MFIDRIRIQVQSGRGGDGIISWIRRKYIPKGGPGGGNGGCGGDVYIEADPQVSSLEWYWNQHALAAQDGAKGGGDLRHGKRGRDLILRVPPGTQVYNAQTEELILDVAPKQERYKLLRGGRGGWGNEHFKTPTNRSPVEWTPGKPCENIELILELKLIADVGLLGLPNAGKSSLLKKLTYAPVKTAPYPFTTLTPNLGYLRFEDYRHVIVADVPGIIEGAHDNRGLGLEFLRHIERTKVLLWVIDASATDGRDPAQDYEILRSELLQHNKELLQRPFVVVLNKMDLEASVAFVEDFYRNVAIDPSQVVEISALTGEGIDKLLDKLLPYAHV